MGRLSQNPHASVFVDGLIKELDTVTDPRRRSPILYALARLEEKRPGKRDKAIAYLDEVGALNPKQEDLAFEAWRAANTRPLETKLRALEGVLPYLTDPKDAVHCRLLRAELISGMPGASARVQEELDAADALAENRREQLFARPFIGRENAPEDVAAAFRAVADLTTDSVFAAALLLEVAVLLQREVGTELQVAALIDELLNKPDLDESLLLGAYRMGMKIGRPDLSLRAVDGLFEYARADAAPPPVDKPLGHLFQGFDTGDESAAALAWLKSALALKQLKNHQAASDALAAARALRPDCVQLTVEQALLYEATGAPRKAFEALFTTDLYPARKALTALGAGRPDEALRLAILARDTAKDGLFGQALTEAAADESPMPPSSSPTEVRLAWLEANLSHPDAHAVANALRVEGVVRPYFRLFDEEALTEAQSILDVKDGAEDAPWVHLMEAVLGMPGRRSDRFVRFSEDTWDPILKATLLECGAAFKRDEGAPPDAVEELMKQAETFASATAYPEIRFDPSEAGWHKALTDLETDRSDSDPRETALKSALVNRFALADRDAADRALSPLLSEKPEGIAAELLSIDVAAESGNWSAVLDGLERVSRAVPADSELFDLILGELHLTVSQSYPDALQCFDRAGQSEDKDIADVASLYRLITLHQLNEKAAIEDAMASDAPKQQPSNEGALFEGLFDEPDPEPRDRRAMQRLEGYGTETPQQWIAKMAFTPFDADTPPLHLEEMAQTLERLSDVAGEGPAGEGLRVAAALIEGRPYVPGPSTSRIDDEHLNYADLAVADDSASQANRTVAILKCEQQAAPGDPEWIEQMLTRAEAEAAEEQYDLAVETLQEALESAPEHPGLLETLAWAAPLAGRHAVAADTHGRLAGFYDSEEAMIHHLAQAALILYDKLDNAEGACNICREALRRSPEHAELNDIISHIIDACRDLPPSAEESTPEDKAPEHAAEEETE